MCVCVCVCLSFAPPFLVFVIIWALTLFCDLKPNLVLVLPLFCLYVALYTFTIYPNNCHILYILYSYTVLVLVKLSLSPCHYSRTGHFHIDALEIDRQIKLSNSSVVRGCAVPSAGHRHRGETADLSWVFHCRIMSSEFTFRWCEFASSLLSWWIWNRRTLGPGGRPTRSEIFKTCYLFEHTGISYVTRAC